MRSDVVVYFALDFSNLNRHLLKITYVPKAGRPGHEKNWYSQWTMITCTQNCYSSDQGSDMASKILGFLKVLKVQPLDICRNTSILTAICFLSHAWAACTSPEFRNKSFCAELCLVVCSQSLLSRTSRHSRGYCFHLNHGDTITPFSQHCPRVTVLSFAWEH